MTAPFLSLAQIRNRLTLAARRTLREQIRRKDRCPTCGASAADTLRALGEERLDVSLQRLALSGERFGQIRLTPKARKAMDNVIP
ncbi:hypothetical protein GCM10011608_27010 [Micromonospora sonchi]|uniref:Uncharacterized protein n=1 Tax=Micromonospora sonchi TaxID=1763543 RepID=A0A917TW33_9ACTN|nr:hypothetical protein GCM10011608_27010 [Micromonospora sonchi]